MKKYSMFIMIIALFIFWSMTVLNIGASTISDSTYINYNTSSTNLNFIYAALNPDTIIDTMQLNTRSVSEITTTEGAGLDLRVQPYVWTDDDLKIIAQLAGEHKVIETLEDPSWIYNCHSYAWYLDDDENEYWIASPKPFIDDVHCIPITDEDDVLPGDIAVYYKETNGVYDYKHSAIVYDIYDEEGEKVVILDSKWGAWGAYRHYLELVPDTYISDADSDGKPDVLYYRYTQGEHCLSDIIEDNRTSGHTIKCGAERNVNGVDKACSYTTECDSTATCISYNSSQHYVSCSNCGCSGYLDHDLYMYSAETEDYTVKCHDCDYTVRCTQCPEYYGTDGTGHWVDCPDGCYSFFEPHTPGSYTDIDEPSHEVVCADCGCTYYEDHNYGSCYYTTNANYHYFECVDCGYEYAAAHILSRSMTTDLFYHNVECSICGYTSTESHTWESSGLGYECSDCGMISDSVPGIMSLPDPELEAYLASLSDEERDAFIASLPEDQVARVTALLPSDDEYLTE